MMWLPDNTSPIVLDITTRSIAAVQVRSRGGVRAGGGHEAVAWADFGRSEPGRLITPTDARRLRGVLDRAGFCGSTVHAIVPSHMLRSSMFEAPGRSTPQTVCLIGRTELARSAGLQPHAVEAHAWMLPSAQSGKETASSLVAGCVVAEAEPWLAALDDAGFDIAAMVPRPAALAFAGRRVLGHPTGVWTAVDVDWDATTIVIAVGESIVYQRSCDELSLLALGERLAKETGIDVPTVVRAIGLERTAANVLERTERAKRATAMFIETLREEISLALGYAMHRYGDAPVGGCACTGRGAGPLLLLGAVSDAAGVAANVFGPGAIARVWRSGDISPPLCLGTATGLAVWTQEEPRWKR